ncbi:MAG: ribosome small subunit-dependent GTPase A [Calditrichaeota bacterium]|nr:ribosome small subunit-dependent GTPase A [Calditrichota bacterium]MCB9369951.1 ribosome small subunit-dependent GTPase A [Calditrichota bacterium]
MLTPPSTANARVATIARRTCLLRLNSGEQVEAVLRGKLFDSEDGGVAVGDWVDAQLENGQWAVEEVLQRANAYLRKGLRKEKQVMFANADRVLIVASLLQPVTKIAAIDRFLVAALFGKVSPVLILTKSDLDETGDRLRQIREVFESFDFPIFTVSNVSGQGVDALRELLSEGVSAIIGNSGVGKSSLLNSLIPELELRVREVSTWSGKGTHTTTAALLVPYGERAMLVDTPGMKSFVPYGLTKENLTSLFPEIQELAKNCRFRNCKHIAEPNCAVLEALDENTLPESRYKSFHRLMSEVVEEY